MTDMIRKSVRISLDKLCFQWRITGVMILTLCVSLVACGFMRLYHKVYDYSETSCRAVLTEDLENTGMIYVKNGGYQLEGARLFMQNAIEQGSVRAIGCIVTLKVNRLPELAKIQAENEKTGGQGFLTWNYVDETFLDMCSLQFEKGMIGGECLDGEENENETRFLLYLGYNFREIPIGTCYREKISEDETFVYEVAGILKKGEQFLSPEIMNGGSAGTGNAAISLDNQVLFCGKVPPPSAFWVYSFREGENADYVRDSLKKMAEKRGLEIEFSSLKASFDYAKMKSGQLQAVFGRLFTMVSAMVLFISLSAFLVHFIKNAGDYGILYADGFSTHEIQVSCVMENIWQCLSAFFAAETIVYFAGRTFFGTTVSGKAMVDYVYWHNILPVMALDAVGICLVISVIPVTILKFARPITLLRGGQL